MQYKNWFNCTVKIRKHSDEGSSNTSEQHLIQAYTYSEAEAGMHEIMQQMGGGTFEISNITKTNISEVHPDEASEKWFKVKVSLVAYDEESGREKQTAMYFLVAGENIMEVYNKTKTVMKGYGTGYVIPSITYSKILEVYAADESEGVSETSKPETEVIHEEEFSVGEPEAEGAERKLVVEAQSEQDVLESQMDGE
ncbi:MAG: DUF4494 family protein [Bacteroidota bacterium]